MIMLNQLRGQITQKKIRLRSFTILVLIPMRILFQKSSLCLLESIEMSHAFLVLSMCSKAWNIMRERHTKWLGFTLKDILEWKDFYYLKIGLIYLLLERTLGSRVDSSQLEAE